MANVHIRFYEELNDFLPLDKRKKEFIVSVATNTGVKDVIESLGVPHTEIDLILVNRKSVSFSYKVQDEDYISVFPMFESLDISELVHLRPEPLRKPKFILDVHLGKLAKYLRLLGFDVIYENNFSDQTIVTRSLDEKRIILTRDLGLLKNKKVTHGYWIREIQPEKQVHEVLKRLDLYLQSYPFTRCIKCNGMLIKTSKHDIVQQLLPRTKLYFENFVRCDQCNKIYWQGTHFDKLCKLVEKFLSLGHSSLRS